MSSKILDEIPTVGDIKTDPPPFPLNIEPFDSEWWLEPEQKAICDVYLGECKMEKACAVKKFRKYKNSKSVPSSFIFNVGLVVKSTDAFVVV